MEDGSSPRVLTTKRRIKYRKSLWSLNEFEVWSSEMVCRVVVLRMDKSVLVWVGGREAHLGEVALGVPRERAALATALLGAAGDAAELARRLSATLQRPAYVCYGQTFDRLTTPLVERGIAAQIKSHPEYF